MIALVACFVLMGVVVVKRIPEHGLPVSKRGSIVPEPILGVRSRLGSFVVEPIPGVRSVEGGLAAGFTPEDLIGQVTVLHFWNTRCPACLEEHAHLVAFARTGRVTIYGIVPDEPDAARDFLADAGSPYVRVAVARSSQLAFRLAVRSDPTTVVIDREGRLVKKVIGGLTPERIRDELMPAVEEAERTPKEVGLRPPATGS